MPEICWLISPVAFAVCSASDGVDQLDDVTDAGGGFRQLRDLFVGGLRLMHGLSGDRCGILHLPADLVPR
jgi:hypothetical protein